MNHPVLQLGNQAPYGKGVDPGCMDDDVSRRFGPCSGGAFTIFVYMDVMKLDQELHQLYVMDIDRDFVDFCNAAIPDHPVPINLSKYANEYMRYLDHSLVVMSGHRRDEWADFAEMCEAMKAQEIGSGRWNDLPSDVMAAADLIAHRSYDGLVETEESVEDPEHLFLVIGLYSYAVVACNDCFEARDYRKLFVLAWLIYYGTVLGIEHNGSAVSGGFLS